MATGISSTTANTILTGFGGTGLSVATVYVKLHTGDPGSAGTANASSTTTRVAVTWNAASAGSRAASNTPTWSNWAGSSETLTHISLWDASTAGTFNWSGVLATSKPIASGDTFTLTSLSLALSPLAA